MDIDANDDDIGENARLTYSFDGDTNEFGPFQINRQTGVISAVGQIDREAQSFYTVMNTYHMCPGVGEWWLHEGVLNIFLSGVASMNKCFDYTNM